MNTDMHKYKNKKKCIPDVTCELGVKCNMQRIYNIYTYEATIQL